MSYFILNGTLPYSYKFRFCANVDKTIISTFIIHLIFMKALTIFLQAILVVIGIGAVVALLWEPRLEGRNVHATLFEIYFKDPFLAYVYISSTPFFIALFQAFRALGYVRHDRAFSPSAVLSLRTIKRCAIATAILIIIADSWIVIANDGKDDYAGAVALGAMATFVSVVVAAIAAIFERILQNGINITSGNDLVVSK